ncbi:1,4-dihydroxy-2-naphthoate polyprenyltransferase [Desulforhopalus sp. IMCC35007]|uniref:1,4-dihydroxy-2-naphthoate polyprenyltransferase n=1 Tax=Desulforhopalus sp. IMCC35007 TaxID=2569543 RepID=UPI0010AEE51E|nr:1,4-dihydroxy-2-naphthoate polyprenyltransferase [Desulforhopalus sp. IMCC35007]TKB11705.1 1,4-dihydroxy-2-naphthoate polyprenyltransferase [Desulforhopalus sp. IMCC35007]
MQQHKQFGKFQLWWMAIRPKTLPAAVGPVAVGTAVAMADDAFLFLPALGCFLGAMLLQIGVNLANDYFDFKNNIDSDERQGPVRVTQSGLIPPSEVKRGMIVSLVLAALVFLYLGVVGGFPILLVGIVSVLAALAYSGGPFPLASNGLGEIFVFIFFGLVAVGATYYIQAKVLTTIALMAAIPPGFLITAIMVVNNLRDIDTDKKAGKRTLAVMLGRFQTIMEYKALLWASYLVPLVMLILGMADAFILLPLTTLPMARSLMIKVECDLGSNLNELLASTARLSLIYSLMFSFGLVYRF